MLENVFLHLGDKGNKKIKSQQVEIFNVTVPVQTTKQITLIVVTAKIFFNEFLNVHFFY